VLVTHDLDVAAKAQRVVRMKDGEVSDPAQRPSELLPS
jgi:predicted ABC-type transport system involved in lysophospholipase L1 biosynthesis ATPase subunit